MSRLSLQLWQNLLSKPVKKTDELTTHHYIKEEQSKFLKTLKETLGSNDIIVQMEFAENYSFLIQHSSQGFHWNNCQATIHPIVIYYKPADNTQLLLYHTHTSMMFSDTTI